MHGRKKSDLPQTKQEKDALQAKISNYKKVDMPSKNNLECLCNNSAIVPILEGYPLVNRADS